jgi:hypothetical protein
VRVLFLDVDGVLNRTGYHPGTSLGLRSWIEAELATRLNEVLHVTGAQIVMSSDWRVGRALSQLREELAAAGIAAPLIGATPTMGGARWQQIQAWMEANQLAAQDIVVVDDGYDMGPLASRFVRTSPLNGLDQQAADAIVALYPP